MIASILQAALANAVVAAGMALAVGVVMLFRPKPAVAHALWLLVLVKLITPPVISVPVHVGGLASWLPQIQVNDAVETASAIRRPDSLRTDPRSTDSQSRTSSALGPSMPNSSVHPSSAPQQTRMPLETSSVGTDQHARTPSQTSAEPNEGHSAPRIVPQPTNGLGALAGQPLFKPAIPGNPQMPAVSSKTGPVGQAASASAGAGGFALTALLAVWGVVSLGWFGLAVYRVSRLTAAVRRLGPADNTVEQLAVDAAKRLGLALPLTVRFTHAVTPPMLVWIWPRPVVVLPRQLVADLPPDQQALVIAHELAHFLRKDHWVRWLEFLVIGVYWWHPAVWFAVRQLREAEEHCCDAWVVKAFPDRAKGYAQALLATVDFLAEVRVAFPAGACGLRPLPSFRRRLEMIIVRSVSPKLSAAATWTIALAALLALPWVPRAFSQSVPAPEPAASSGSASAASSSSGQQPAAAEPGAGAAAARSTPSFRVTLPNSGEATSASGDRLAQLEAQVAQMSKDLADLKSVLLALHPRAPTLNGEPDPQLGERRSGLQTTTANGTTFSTVIVGTDGQRAEVTLPQAPSLRTGDNPRVRVSVQLRNTPAADLVNALSPFLERRGIKLNAVPESNVIVLETPYSKLNWLRMTIEEFDAAEDSAEEPIETDATGGSR